VRPSSASQRPSQSHRRRPAVSAHARINLAVATLALALVIEAQIFAVGNRTGGSSDFDIHGTTLFGVNVDATAHPRRYAALSTLAFVVACIVVANVRRGRVGRRLLAVRSNERAAASLGISVFGAKLYAFGLAAGLAAVGGILICFQQQRAVLLPTFASLQSIFIVVYAVIGGIGFVPGAVIGALVAPTGLATVVLGKLFHPLQTSYVVQLGLGRACLSFSVASPTVWRRSGGRAGCAASAWLGANRARPRSMRAGPSAYRPCN